MTRGRTVWLAMLAAGLAIGLLLRAPKRERPESSAREASSAVAPSSGNADDLVEVEIGEPPDNAAVAKGNAVVGAEVVNEIEILRSMHATWKSEPARAVALAEQGERRFGESPRAVERRLYEIKALVALGRVGSARTKAERYLELYPPGPMTDEVERLTGVHRRPPP